ncbi:hypothetical protein ACVFI8_21190 [Agarivorans sp. MS3-6]
MKKWTLLLLFYCPLIWANQVSIEVITEAYPKLSVLIENTKQTVLREFVAQNNESSYTQQQHVLALETASTTHCLSDSLDKLNGRMIILDFQLSNTVNKQLNVISQNANRSDLEYLVSFPNGVTDCLHPIVLLHFPSLFQFSSAWGRVENYEDSSSHASNFFVIHKVGAVYRFQLAPPEPQRAQSYWLNYYAEQ